LTDQFPEEWGSEYRRRRPVYEGYCARLKDLVLEILQAKGIDVISVEARTKTVESFVDKISRKQKYEDPLTEVTDLVGLRVTTYYLEDVETVSNILSAQFNILEEVSRETQIDPGQFGYASKHYVVMLGETRRGLPEWQSSSHIRAEFQVRTALQHAWAAVSHKLDYKSPVAIPPQLRRKLMRLSALFELADEQFSALRSARQELDEQNAFLVAQGNLNMAIDASSLDAYLRESPNVSRVIDAARQEGWHVYGAEDSPTMDVADDRYGLLQLFRTLQLNSIAKVDEALVETSELARLLGALRSLEAESLGSTAPEETVEGIIALALAQRFSSDSRFRSTEVRQAFLAMFPESWPRVEQALHG
jgi:GTP pyrophosphokinase